MIRSIARPLIAGMFVYGGLDALRQPWPKVPKAERVAPKIADTLGLDVDTEQLVRFNGAVQVAAGVAFAAGIAPRVCAFVLAASLIPTTLAGHPFWTEPDPKVRSQQTIQFLKNAAMLGGLLEVVDRG